MIDIVKRLEAENKQLRVALAKQTEQHEYPCSPHCAGYLREQVAQAEIERLRATLRQQDGEIRRLCVVLTHIAEAAGKIAGER